MIVYGGRRLPYGLLDRNTWSYAPAALLTIEKQTNGAVGVSWLGKFEGMPLESSSTLNAPDWRGVVGIESVGREKRATIVNEQANFYRLRQ
jgi:hypothetical protein